MIRYESKEDAEHLLDLLACNSSEGFWYAKDAALAERLLSDFPELRQDYGFLLNQAAEPDPQER